MKVTREVLTKYGRKKIQVDLSQKKVEKPLETSTEKNSEVVEAKTLDVDKTIDEMSFDEVKVLAKSLEVKLGNRGEAKAKEFLKTQMGEDLL